MDPVVDQLARPELKSPLVIVAHRCPDHAKRRNAVSQLGGRFLMNSLKIKSSIISIYLLTIHIIATLTFLREALETLIPGEF